MKRTKEADDSFLKAYHLNPNLWDVHAQYGSFLLSHHHPAEAIKHFERVRITIHLSLYHRILNFSLLLRGYSEITFGSKM